MNRAAGKKLQRKSQKENMMKKLLAVGISFLFFAITAASTVSYAEPMKKMVLTKSSVELQLSMRKLWEDHITYTRNYIISSLADLGDTGDVAGRLLKNQDDIGDAIKPVYGDDAGNKLAALLRDHILIATEVVKAAKMGTKAELSNASKKWTANADDIAAFLSSANPNWSKSGLEDMLHKHLEFTTQEVVSRLNKDWAADIRAYDNGHVHMLMFADVLSKGIVKQFPDKFSK